MSEFNLGAFDAQEKVHEEQLQELYSRADQLINIPEATLQQREIVTFDLASGDAGIQAWRNTAKNSDSLSVDYILHFHSFGNAIVCNRELATHLNSLAGLRLRTNGPPSLRLDHYGTEAAQELRVLLDLGLITHYQDVLAPLGRTLSAFQDDQFLSGEDTAGLQYGAIFLEEAETVFTDKKDEILCNSEETTCYESLTNSKSLTFKKRMVMHTNRTTYKVTLNDDGVNLTYAEDEFLGPPRVISYLDSHLMRKDGKTDEILRYETRKELEEELGGEVDLFAFLKRYIQKAGPIESRPFSEKDPDAQSVQVLLDEINDLQAHPSSWIVTTPP